MRTSLTAIARLAAEHSLWVQSPSKNDLSHSSSDDSDSSATLRKYTLAEVMEHYSPDDCWIVVSDKVYDVTNFLREHPGGHDVILEHAGRDASLAFHGTGHSQSALQLLDKFCVGVLVEHERLNFFSTDSSLNSPPKILSLST